MQTLFIIPILEEHNWIDVILQTQSPMACQNEGLGEEFWHCRISPNQKTAACGFLVMYSSLSSHKALLGIAEAAREPRMRSRYRPQSPLKYPPASGRPRRRAQRR